jgi:NAD-dependent dihydropyrimidine dehydrogenase PreA subunit
MSIRIDKDICIGCSKCTKTCPGTLIYQDSEKNAYIRYPKDCWGCTACVKVCPVSAISYHLGAEIGGRGAELKVKDEVEKVRWEISADGNVTEIIVDRKESNKY